jgi:hypothetical protein
MAFQVALFAPKTKKYWVHLNKRTEIAIDRDDSEIVRFSFRFSSKKDMDIETIFLAEKVGFRCFH